MLYQTTISGHSKPLSHEKSVNVSLPRNLDPTAYLYP